MLIRFHLIPERYGRTDGQTDGQISISRVSTQMRDKKSSDNYVWTVDTIPCGSLVLTFRCLLCD